MLLHHQIVADCHIKYHSSGNCIFFKRMLRIKVKKGDQTAAIILKISIRTQLTPKLQKY